MEHKRPFSPTSNHVQSDWFERHNMSSQKVPSVFLQEGCSWWLHLLLLVVVFILFFIFSQTHESFNLSHLMGVSFLYLHLEYRSFGLFEAFLIDPEVMFKRENPWANKADNEYQTKDYELSLPIVIKKNNLHSFNLIANLLKFPLIPISCWNCNVKIMRLILQKFKKKLIKK